MCVTLAWNGFIAGTGRLAGADPARDGEVRPRGDLGHQRGVDPGQRDDPRAGGAASAQCPRSSSIDTYRNATAKQADLFVCVRPGTDGALACAVMHVLFRDGHADREYLARYTDCPGELERHLADRTPTMGGAHHRRTGRHHRAPGRG